jgi:hypothetical protein
MKEIKNRDVIGFRKELINKLYSEKVLNEYERKTIEDILIDYNSYFGARGYDLG